MPQYYGDIDYIETYCISSILMLKTATQLKWNKFSSYCLRILFGKYLSNRTDTPELQNMSSLDEANNILASTERTEIWKC